MKLLEQLKKAERYVDEQREYNTSTYVNGYELEKHDGKYFIFVNYEICYDEDRPCDLSFTFFELDEYPSEEEIKELKENNYYISGLM